MLPTEENLDLYGMRPASEGGLLFCGVSEEQFAINGTTYQWPRGSQLTWRLDISRLGTLLHATMCDVIDAALKEISESCDIEHSMAKPGQVANLVIISRRLDGQSGVLADCQIPVGNVNPNTSLLMRFDDSESWVVSEQPGGAEIDFYRVFLHEALHWHGLGHKPVNINDLALIAPVYSRSIRNCQPADKRELVRRYGPRTTPVTPPPDGGVPGALPVKFREVKEISQGDKLWRGEVSGELKRVR